MKSTFYRALASGAIVLSLAACTQEMPSDDAMENKDEAPKMEEKKPDAAMEKKMEDDAAMEKMEDEKMEDDAMEADVDAKAAVEAN